MPSTSLHSQQKRHDSHSTQSSIRDAPTSLRKHSPNRIKSRPADPAVISSIISSLEAFDASPRLSSQRNYSHTSSRRSSAPRSPHGSFASAPSVPFSVSMSPASSPWFGMEYGKQLDALAGADEEEDDESDAALPPTIPTIRSPSTLSRQSTRDSSMTNGSASLRPSSYMSRGRSISPMASPRPSPVKTPSEESRIMVSIQESLQTAARAPRNLIKRRSHATLSPVRIQEEEDDGFDGFSYAASPISEGEEVVRKELKQPRSKERLYLDPDDIVEDKSSGSITPNSIGAGSDATISPMKEVPHQFPPSPVSAPTSPKSASLNADSIPLRTSSLLQQTKKSTSMKKSKKSQPKKTEQSPFKSPRTEKIPDTSWVDLGEDDETVKRIMELRKKRETRLLEPDTANHLGRARSAEPPSEDDKAYDMQDINRPPYNRPSVHRATTEPAKAHKILGFTEPNVPRKPDGTLASSARASPELVRPSAHLSDPKRPLSLQGGSGASSPQRSLDYSYVQAVADVQTPGRETSTIFEYERPSIDAAIPRGIPFRRNSLFAPKGADARSDTSSLLSPSTSQPNSLLVGKGRGGKKSPQNRWTTVAHPDLPEEFVSKRNRRKSMGDARTARLLEEELQTQRRDSVEDAVLMYLKAPRLNQKLKHPTSGRIISFSEVGDPDGAAVLICVGMGLTRFVTAFYDELATTLRLRLVTLERPGVGGSDPYPQNDRSGPLNWADDVLNVCDRLSIQKFSLLAHSAGAVYALAIALVLPHLVNGKVQLLAPWIPPSQLDAVSHSAMSSPPPAGALPRSQRFLRVLPTPLLRAANSSFMTAASTSLKPVNKRKPASTTPLSDRSPSESPNSKGKHQKPTKRPSTSTGDRPDIPRRESMMLMDQYMPSTNPMGAFPLPTRNGVEEDNSDEDPAKLVMSATATPTDPALNFASTALNAAEHAERERQVEYTTRLTQRTWEYAIRDSNPATDLLVCLERNRDVGFRYTDVSRPVVITHGAEDKRVPVANIRWLGDQMNRAAMVSAVGSGGGSALHPVNSLPRAPTRDTYKEDWGLGGGGGCEVRVLEGEGHGLMASPHIMGDVLTAIAREAREAGAMA